MKHEETNQIGLLPPLSSASSVKPVWKVLDFEFMDLPFLPSGLRSTLRDILEVGNGKPFRNYYDWVASSVFKYAQENGIKDIVELGAGCAPITKHLVKKYENWDAHFKVTDLNPDVVTFNSLEQMDKRVVAVYDSLDFTQKITGLENSLLVLSATFHHVEEKEKKHILNSLKKISPHVMIFEPLRPTMSSLLFVLGALFSGFLTPLFRMNSKKIMRTFFWCWLLPVAPILFLWDGWVSALRCWNKKEWKHHEPKAEVEETLFCTKVTLK